jgi:hypothetical protein
VADHFFSTNKGAGLAADVTIATSTQAGTVELRVHDGAFTDKTDILKCIEAIEYAVIQSADVPV